MAGWSGPSKSSAVAARKDIKPSIGRYSLFSSFSRIALSACIREAIARILADVFWDCTVEGVPSLCDLVRLPGYRTCLLYHVQNVRLNVLSSIGSNTEIKLQLAGISSESFAHAQNRICKVKPVGREQLAS